MIGKITPKQAIFVAEYLIDGNATRAATAAGFEAASAAGTGSRLLKNVKVAAAIAAGQARLANKLEITAERVLRELARLAYYDPGKLYDADGMRLPVHRLDEDTRRAVVSVEDETIGAPGPGMKRSQKIRMAEKGANLERLGKHLRLFGDSGFSAAVETGASGLPPDSTVRIVFVRPE